MRAVPCKVRIDAFYDGFGKVGYQFNPTVDDVVEALLDVYQNYSHYKALAIAAKPWVEQFTAKKLITRWEMLLSPKQVLFGSRNEVTDTYFMTNSLKLYAKLKRRWGK